MLRLLSVVIVLFLASLGCSEKEDTSFAETIEGFNNGTVYCDDFINWFLENNAENVFPPDASLSENGTVYSIDGAEGSITLYFPVSKTISIDDIQSLSEWSLEFNEDMVALWHGEIVVFKNFSGKTLAERVFEGSQVYAAFPGRKEFYVFAGENLYSLFNDKGSWQSRSIITLTPPFKASYRAVIRNLDTHLAVFSGIAGRYSFSLISLEGGVKQVYSDAASSTTIARTDSRITYVTGKQGQWRITDYSLSDTSKQHSNIWSELNNLVLFSGGSFISTTDSQIYTAAHEFVFPFRLNVARIKEDYFLIRHSGRLFLMEKDRLFLAMPEVYGKAPDIKKCSGFY